MMQANLGKVLSSIFGVGVEQGNFTHWQGDTEQSTIFRSKGHTKGYSYPSNSKHISPHEASILGL